jgi:hypothetical protein
MRETIDEIHNLRDELDDNKKLNSDAIDEAIQFLQQLQPGTLQPTVEVQFDGEIELHWIKDYLELQVGFYGDGTYSFYAKNNKLDDTISGDNIPVNIISQRIVPYINPRKVFGIEGLSTDYMKRLEGISQLNYQSPKE